MRGGQWTPMLRTGTRACPCFAGRGALRAPAGENPFLQKARTHAPHGYPPGPPSAKDSYKVHHTTTAPSPTTIAEGRHPCLPEQDRTRRIAGETPATRDHRSEGQGEYAQKS